MLKSSKRKRKPNNTKPQKVSLKKPQKDGDEIPEKLVPAWHDPDDDIRDEDGIQNRRVKLDPKIGELYKNRLVENFEMVYGPTPEWAKLDKPKKKTKTDSDIESDTEEHETDQKLPKSSFLIPGKLNILRVLDLNSVERAEGAIIRSIDFHPKNPVGLVAGSSGVVSLYQVDGTTNALIQTVGLFDNFPLRKAQFCPAGDEIYASSGLVGHFYTYDMISGKTLRTRPNHETKNETIRNLVPSPDNKIIATVGHRGNIYLFSKSSKEIIDTFSISGEVKDIAFDSDGREMFVYSDQGEVYRWNMSTRRCVEKFSGEANFDGTCLSVSSKYIACGSTSGFVSVFDNKYEPVKEDEVISCRIRKPLDELGNIQTVITSLKFNSTEEILAISSVDKDNAIRLVHLPSLTVFPRFPFVNSNFGRSNCITFSPNSGYMAIGNNRGCAYLFRLKHFENY